MNTLASYTRNKVDSNEISGDVFVSNFLIKELNKENELQSVKDLIEYSKKVLPTTLDFYINSGEPISIKDEQISEYNRYHNLRRDFDKNNFPYQFTVESKIGYKQNVKYKNWRDHFNRTIKSIDLNEDEISEYVNLNIDTYPFILNNEILYLRNFSSIKSLIEFYLLSNNSSYYFTLKYNGLDKSYDFKDFFQDNKVPNDLVFGGLYYAIIENGEIKYFEYCDKIDKGPGNVHIRKPNYDPCTYYSDKFNKYFLKRGFYGRARFPYFNIISVGNITRVQLEPFDKRNGTLGRYGRLQPSKGRYDNNVYPKQTQKSEIIFDYFGRKDFPKKLRTKDNYKKIENELLILNQDERKLNYILNTIFDYNEKVKYDDYTLLLQTNLSFDQSMIIKSYFILEELKKFRGFKITNSN